MSIQNIYNKLKAFIITEEVFFKNVSFVFGGKVYVAILSLILTPIIARLFSPENYGEFALYNMLVQNLVVFGTLSLPLAISTVKKEDLSEVFSLAITIIFYFIFVFTISLFLFNSQLDNYFSTIIFSNYWGYMLLGFSFFSANMALASLNVRLKRFRLNTKIYMIEASSAKASNLSTGMLSLGSFGLILSDTLAKIINFILLIIKLPQGINMRFLSFKSTKKALIKYKAFPLYALPASWIGTISNQFIILLVASLYSKSTLGQLSMAIALLSIPLNVLSNSFQPVITERLTAIREGEKSYRFFEKTFILILTISILCFTIINLLPGNLFTTFLGKRWTGVDNIINIYSWYYILLFVDQAFQSGFVIFDKQRIKLIFNIIDIAMLLIVAAVSLLNAYEFEILLVALITIKMIVSSGRITFLWKIANKHFQND